MKVLRVCEECMYYAHSGFCCKDGEQTPTGIWDSCESFSIQDIEHALSTETGNIKFAEKEDKL